MDRKRTEKELRAKIQEERGAPKAVRPDAPAKNEAEAARAATEESRQKPATPRQGAAAAGPSEPSSAHRRRSSTPAELRERPQTRLLPVSAIALRRQDRAHRWRRPVPCDDRLTSAASKHVQRCRSRPRKQNVVGVAALFSCELETFQQKMLLLPGWHQILVRRKKDCSIPLPVICLCFARTGASPHSNQKAGQAAEPAGSPRQMMQVLVVHAEALKRRLETQQAERDNLRFQLRLLQRDKSERQPSWLEQQVAYLEAENRNSAAVQDESDRLARRLQAVEASLAEHDAEPSKVKAVAEEAQVQEELSDGEKWILWNRELECCFFRGRLASELDEDDINLARWECRNVERRLEQARSYNRALMEELLVATASRTSAPQPPAEPRPSARGRATRGGASVDVLTIGAGPGGEDVEWHKDASTSRQ
eukprot:s155_g6.t2